MLIKTANGNLLLSDDSEISLVITNPMFSEKGSISLPFSVPQCVHNRNVLGISKDISGSTLLDFSINATIITKHFSIKGVIIYLNSDNRSIELAFLLNECILASKAKKIMLRDLEGYSYATSATKFTTLRDSLINLSWPAVEMAMFPIASHEVEGNLNNYDSEDFDNETMISEYYLLNPIHYFLQDIDYTSGFNICLYLNKVIRLVANNLGLILVDNDFENDIELAKLVILNGKEVFTAPEGWFSWHQRDMVPNISVFEFIQGLEKLFGAIFLVDYTTSELRVKLFKNLLTEPPVDIYFGAYGIQSFPRIGIHFKANVTNSAYTKTFDKAINSSVYDPDEEDESRIDGKVYDTSITNPYDTDNVNVFCVSTQNHFNLSWEKINDNLWHYKASSFHSNYHEVFINDIFDDLIHFNSCYHLCPMAPLTGRFFVDSMHIAYDRPLILPEVRKWENTFSKEYNIRSEEKSLPFSLAFYRGKVLEISLPYEWNGETDFNIPFGTTDVFLPDGSKFEYHNYALRYAGENGLIEKFFQEIIYHYSNANKVVFIYPDYRILSLINKPWQKFMVDNHQAFWHTIEISFSPTKFRLENVSVVTTKYHESSED